MSPAGRGPRGWERGSFTLESAICMTVLVPFLGLMGAFGLAGVFDSSVDNAAAAGARAASQATDAGVAVQRGRAAAHAALAQQHRSCSPGRVQVDVAGFARPVGDPASVTVSVECSVPLAQLGVPGLPGAKTLSARATSVLDQYSDRAR